MNDPCLYGPEMREALRITVANCSFLKTEAVSFSDENQKLIQGASIRLTGGPIQAPYEDNITRTSHDNGFTESSAGDRSTRVQIMCEVTPKPGEATAPEIMERVKARLRFSSSRASLLIGGCAVQSIGEIAQFPRAMSRNRTTSRACFELWLNAARVESDTAVVNVFDSVEIRGSVESASDIVTVPSAEIPS